MKIFEDFFDKIETDEFETEEIEVASNEHYDYLLYIENISYVDLYRLKSILSYYDIFDNFEISDNPDRPNYGYYVIDIYFNKSKMSDFNQYISFTKKLFKIFNRYTFNIVKNNDNHTPFIYDIWDLKSSYFTFAYCLYEEFMTDPNNIDKDISSLYLKKIPIKTLTQRVINAITYYNPCYPDGNWTLKRMAMRFKKYLDNKLHISKIQCYSFASAMYEHTDLYRIPISVLEYLSKDIKNEMDNFDYIDFYEAIYLKRDYNYIIADNQITETIGYYSKLIQHPSGEFYIHSCDKPPKMSEIKNLKETGYNFMLTYNITDDDMLRDYTSSSVFYMPCYNYGYLISKTKEELIEINDNINDYVDDRWAEITDIQNNTREHILLKD